jgi:hypothetical protein
LWQKNWWVDLKQNKKVRVFKGEVHG